MSKKTINQALKDLFLGLGGDSSALADNSSVSDYVEDLESAIKGAASGAVEEIIDDEAASETTTYSSTKIESLIPTDELPSVTSDDNGKILAVANGAWTLGTLTASANLETGAVTFTFTPDTPAT
jgi:hypothetical protein